MRKILPIVALVVFPLIFLIAGLSFHRAQFSADPEYAYLLNGLNVASLKSVGHFDHPGTTAQMWNALIIRIVYAFDQSGQGSLQKAVLGNPDHYVGILISSLKLLNALAFFLLGWVVYRKMKLLAPALILQVTPFLSANLMEETWTKLSPEPMLVMAASLLIMAIVSYYYAQDRSRLKYPVLFALVVSFGMASKVTFLPLALIPLIILEKFRNKLIYVFSCIPAFILFTIPAIPAYKLMIKWFTGLGTHSGTYGQGKEGFIDPDTYLSNIAAILKNNLAFSISLGVLSLVFIALFLIRKRRNMKVNHIVFKYSFTLILVQVFGILLVAKHYHMNHYIFPVICLTGISWIFIWKILSETFLLDQKALNIGLLVTLTGLIIASALNKPYLQLADHYYKLTNEEYAQTQQTLLNEYKDAVIVNYYPYSINPLNALRWGNVYARQVYSEDLKTMYNDKLFFDVFEKSFASWSRLLSPAEVLNVYGTNLLMVGGPLSDAEMANVTASGINLIPIVKGRTQAIFRIDTASVIFRNPGTDLPLTSLCFTMDSLSQDKQWILAGNERMPADGKLSASVAHSGQQAYRLSGKDIYGLPYQLKNIEPGQQYRISVWRKGDAENTFLVAAAENTSQLYLQSATCTEGKPDQWNRIQLDLTIPENLTTPLIKIYVWNNSGKEVYFDDLSISRLK